MRTDCDQGSMTYVHDCPYQPVGDYMRDSLGQNFLGTILIIGVIVLVGWWVSR